MSKNSPLNTRKIAKGNCFLNKLIFSISKSPAKGLQKEIRLFRVFSRDSRAFFVRF